MHSSYQSTGSVFCELCVSLIRTYLYTCTSFSCILKLAKLIGYSGIFMDGCILSPQVVSLPLQSVIHGGCKLCAAMDTLIDQDGMDVGSGVTKRYPQNVVCTLPWPFLLAPPPHPHKPPQKQNVHTHLQILSTPLHDNWCTGTLLNRIITTRWDHSSWVELMWFKVVWF